MRTYLHGHMYIAIHLVFFAIAIFIGAGVAYYNQKHVESSLLRERQEQEKYMYELATITDRNGVDETTATIVSDCARREEYETLLNSLATLNKKELVIIQNLFENCGNYYAERKALMVSKLKREFESYEFVDDLLVTVNPNTTNYGKRATWSELVANEQARSALLNEQRVIQGHIINKLIAGFSIHSNDVNTLSQDAQKIEELLIAHNDTIDVLREEIQN